MLSTLLTTLLILNVLFLVLLIIGLQHGNEGGLGSALGSGNSAGFFGASGGVNFIVKATWVAGATFFLLALSLSYVKTKEHYGVGTELRRSLLEGQESPGTGTQLTPAETPETPDPQAAPETPPEQIPGGLPEAPPAAPSAP